MSFPYFFFRPLLTSAQVWGGVRLESAHPETMAAEDYQHCLPPADAEGAFPRLPLLLAVAPECLGRREFIQIFGAHQAIFLLPPDALDAADVPELCREVRNSGHLCAIRLESREDIRRMPPDVFDYFCVDGQLARTAPSAIDFLHSRQKGLRGIALGIASEESFQAMALRRFDLIDNSFVTSPATDETQAPDLFRMKLLKLLTLVTQDADSRDIESVIREEPKLSYNLLRLVNSVAVGTKTTISSFNQAITVLGRRQLQRWLQLLIYTNEQNAGEGANPLLQQAALRARQMELMSRLLTPPCELPDCSDAFFMTGMFSLLDRVLKLPMEQVVAALPLPPAVTDALRERTGVAGQLLTAVIAAEKGDFPAAEAGVAALGIAPPEHAAAQLAALEWANRIALPG